MATRVENFLVGRDGLRYAVLAERSCEHLEEGKQSLWAAWTRLRRSVSWKRKVKGCIVVMEVTYNSDAKTFHPHLNVLMEGEYFPFEELNQAWVWATSGRGQTSFIRAADAGTVRELIKYVTKVIDLLGSPVVLNEFLLATQRARMVRTYGSFYGVTKEVEGEENQGTVCKVCESPCVVKLSTVPAWQVMLAFTPKGEEYFRVDRPPGETASRMFDLVQFYPDTVPPPRYKPESASERVLRDVRRKFGATFGRAA